MEQAQQTYNRMSKQKRGIQYIKNDEPAFLKRMKQQVGYKEGPTVETKKQHEHGDGSDSDQERDDEKPQVVVLSPGDLTEEQANHVKKEAETKPREATDEKIIFKKPDKSSKTDDKTTEKKKSTAKRIKNSSLLSFNDDD